MIDSEPMIGLWRRGGSKNREIKVGGGGMQRLECIVVREKMRKPMFMAGELKLLLFPRLVPGESSFVTVRS